MCLILALLNDDESNRPTILSAYDRRLKTFATHGIRTREQQEVIC